MAKVSAPPPPPAPPSDTTTTAVPPPPAPDAPIVDTPETAAVPQLTVERIDGVNGPVTTGAELHGGVLASDAKKPLFNADDDFAELTDNKLKRSDEVSLIGFEVGRAGHSVGSRPKTLTDEEWARYLAGYQRGQEQRAADQLTIPERLSRIERTLGLAVPNAGKE